MALPLGELSPQVTERAHAVGFVAEVLGVIRKLPAVLLPLPLRKDFPRSGGRCRVATKGGVWHRVAMTERASSFYITICALLEPSVRSSCASQMQACR